MAAAAPPPPAADAPAAAAANDHPIVDRNVWLACAVPLSRLPAVGSQVYYFPHGHAEQCPAHLPAPLPAPHLFPCTVTAVALGADGHTNEVFARISLRPGPHRGAPVPPDPQPPAHHLIPYSTKGLTNSDANNGGGFSVPRYCADHVFPRLDLDSSRTPVQNITVTDMDGAEWQFRHIYRGTPRRHLLTTGWSTFVNAKLLVSQDKAVFMRRPDGKLLIGLRREPRYRIADTLLDPSEPPPRNARARVPPEDVMEAARLAAQGAPFTVTYFPRKGAGEFVVPRKEVEDALAVAARWEPGTQVRMQVMESEDTRRIGWATGTVKAIVHQNIWRALQVDWDEPSPSSLSHNNASVNAWQLQLVAYPPHLPKRPRIPTLCSGLDFGSSLPLPLPGVPAAAIGMQGAKHIGGRVLPSPPPSHPLPIPAGVLRLTTQLLFPIPSRDLIEIASDDPEAAASPPSYPANIIPPPAADLLPVQAKTIQLFGTTITSLKQPLDNGAPNNAGVADHENAQAKGA